MGKLSETEMINHVKKAINPVFKNWVLFSHGTYIIFEDSAITDFKQKAIELMKEFGPVYPGSAAGDITVTKLRKTEGWSIGGHCYGMYTYVHPIEIEKNNPADIDAGLAGRHKREMDGKELKIIFINK